MSSNTDTGLVTVAKVDSRLGDMSRLSIIDRPLSIGTEVCLRSQAEELLAAKDAQIAGWTESGKLWTAEIRELQADNAALTSEKQSMLNAMGDMANSNKKLKAKLETYHEEYENRKEGYEKTIDSLEKKLAAAEKALESYKSIVKDVCESQRGTKWGKAAECIFDAIERAALEKKD